MIGVRGLNIDNTELHRRAEELRGEGGTATLVAVDGRPAGVSRQVFMTPEAAAEPCVRSALLAHEGRHDRTLDEAIHVFIQQRRGKLAPEIAELKDKRASDQGAAVKAFEAGLATLTTRMMKEFKEEQVTRIRRSVDTDARLAELRRPCHGRLGELEESARHDGQEM